MCVHASVFLRKTRKGEKEWRDCGAASEAKRMVVAASAAAVTAGEATLAY